MDVELYKKAMEVGHLFNTKLSNDYWTDDWNASEEASYFCVKIIKKSKKYGYNVEETFEKYAEKIIKKIESKKGKLRSHMWDEYCKGFLVHILLSNNLR